MASCCAWYLLYVFISGSYCWSGPRWWCVKMVITGRVGGSRHGERWVFIEEETCCKCQMLLCLIISSLVFHYAFINQHTLTGTSTGRILLATHDLGIHRTDSCAIWRWCYFNKRHLHWFWNLWRTLESTEVWWIYLTYV